MYPLFFPQGGTLRSEEPSGDKGVRHPPEKAEGGARHEPAATGGHSRRGEDNGAED